jgi:hypothetical protein
MDQMERIASRKAARRESRVRAREEEVRVREEEGIKRVAAAREHCTKPLGGDAVSGGGLYKLASS